MARMGPIPKRRDERMGHKSASEIDGPTFRRDEPVSIPRLPPRLHPIARLYFRSVKASLASRVYEPTEWALAVFVTVMMDRVLTSSILTFKGDHVTAIMRAADSLLGTEAARRRVRLEIERPTPGTGEGEKPKEIRDYRTRLRTVSEAEEDASDPDGADVGGSTVT